MSSASAPWKLPSNDSSVWFYGVGPDLIFGYGLGYLIVVPLLLGLALNADATVGLAWTGAAILLVTATPHYGATLLRVYEERSERRRYAVFAVWITAGLALLFLAGLYQWWLGCLLLTIYVSWSPWHFAGQNYGLAVMYLRRAGGDIDPGAKRLLYLAFVVSAVLSFVVIHIADSSLVFAQGAYDKTGTFATLKLGIPTGVGVPLAGALLALYLGLLVAFALTLRPRASLRGLVPVISLVLLQSLWFVVPAVATAYGAGSVRLLLPFTATAISVAHSIQYLWVTSHFAGLSAHSVRRVPFFAKCLLAGAAVSTPGLLFTPELLGDAAPYTAGVVVLCFSVVNIHHFILDGAVWKLRDGRVARALLRSQRETQDAVDPSTRHPLRNALLAVGVIGVAAKLAVVILTAQIDRLDGEPRDHYRQTQALALLGRATPELWAKVAYILEGSGAVEEAIDAWSHAVDTPAPTVVSAIRLTWMLITHRHEEPASLAEATRLGEYLVETLGQTRAEGHQALAAVHMAAGRYAEGVAMAERALVIARSNKHPARIRQVQEQVDTYRAQARFHATRPAR